MDKAYCLNLFRKNCHNRYAHDLLKILTVTLIKNVGIVMRQLEKGKAELCESCQSLT
jgi:hypothetical protein